MTQDHLRKPHGVGGVKKNLEYKEIIVTWQWTKGNSPSKQPTLTD